MSDLGGTLWQVKFSVAGPRHFDVDPQHFDVEPKHLDADADPSFHFDSDLSPTNHFDGNRYSEPVPAPYQNNAKLRPLVYRPSTAPFWAFAPPLLTSTTLHGSIMSLHTP